MNTMAKVLSCMLILLGMILSTSASAAKTPEGYWVATSPFFYDRPIAVVKLYVDSNKKLCGQIVKVLPLNGSIDPSRKLAASGPVVMCGFQERKGSWVNGRIYEQITAKIYTGSITMTNDGDHLYVRGYKGSFFRTARWDRVR